MTKAEILQHLADKTGLTQKQINQVLAAQSELLRLNLIGNLALALPGIGIFKPVQKSARVGRNPQTGATVHIPARTGVSLKLEKQIRDALI